MAKAVVLKQKQIALAAEKGKFGENRLAWWWMEKILKHTEFGQHLNQQINQLWRTPWTAMEGQKPASPDDASPPPGLTPLCCHPCTRPKLSQLVLSILKVFMRARSCQWRFSWGCFAAQGRRRARPRGSTPWMTTVIIKNLNIRTSNSYRCVCAVTPSFHNIPWCNAMGQVTLVAQFGLIGGKFRIRKHASTN